MENPKIQKVKGLYEVGNKWLQYEQGKLEKYCQEVTEKVSRSPLELFDTLRWEAEEAMSASVQLALLKEVAEILSKNPIPAVNNLIESLEKFNQNLIHKLVDSEVWRPNSTGASQNLGNLAQAGAYRSVIRFVRDLLHSYRGLATEIAELSEEEMAQL